jgi:hypothetical protein
MSIKTLSSIVAISISGFLAACGGSTDSAVKSGSSVNNGPGPVGDILVCQGLGDEANLKFTIRHTAAVTLKQGLLQQGEEATSMKCDEVSDEGTTARPDQPAELWNCSELRSGDGLFHVSVHTQGLSNILLADLTQDQMFPLAAAKIATLVCRDADK